MTYKELYEKAASMLDRGEITLGDFNKMVKPLDVEIHHEPHWIPVEQELPEYGVDCIVSVKQKYTWQTDWEYFVDLGWRGDYIDGAWDTANDWDEGQETHISAWMPLPEPYKGVTE